MNWIYVLQDATGHVWGATFEQGKALEKCKEKVNNTYREVPFLKEDGTEIQLIAGPIDKKYLPQG